MEAPRPHRVVALGASNLTRGLPALVATARAAYGPEVEVFAAPGLGRSYGMASRVFVRTLPGILESGLWRQLDALPPRPTRAVISDVGNDILYGATPREILAWVEACLLRLEPHTKDVVLAGLPVDSIKRRSAVTIAAFRTLLFPRCRLSPATIVDRVEAVVHGLRELAAARGCRFFALRPEWYGLDPIHIRPGLWRTAWREILMGEEAHADGRMAFSEALRLYAMWPERQWLLGLHHATPQPGARLPGGGRVWLF
jgi:hypothetical protein